MSSWSKPLCFLLGFTLTAPLHTACAVRGRPATEWADYSGSTQDNSPEKKQNSQKKKANKPQPPPPISY